MKVCGGCHQDLPESAYSPGQWAMTPARGRCRSCLAVRNKAMQIAHPSTAKQRASAAARQRAYRLAKTPTAAERSAAVARATKWNTDNPTRRSAIAKRWRKSNSAYGHAASKAWREANPERAREQSRDWMQANLGRHAERQHRRRARKVAGGVYLVAERDWRRLCARYDNCCAYCGRRAALVYEHVIPLARGGRHSIGNLLPACQPCNASKHTKFLIEWLPTRKKALL